MLIDIDESANEIFNRIEKLPIVLCHRDFWMAFTNLQDSENIFGGIRWISKDIYLRVCSIGVNKDKGPKSK
jgi:hypothetical protein